MAAPTILAMILVGIVLLFVLSWLLQLLWNMTLPDIFEIKRITYWQAFRLFLLSGLLFGSGGSFLSLSV